MLRVAIVLVVAAGCTRTRESRPIASASDETQLSLSHLNGDALSMDTYRGKVVFVNIWATWCRPCIQEMPSIERLRSKMDSSSVSFLFASNESPEDIQKFASKRGFNLSFVRIHNLEELGIQVLPTTYIFGRDGSLIYSEAGLREWDSEENVLLLQAMVNK